MTPTTPSRLSLFFTEPNAEKQWKHEGWAGLANVPNLELSKARVHNNLELLTRVKLVFDIGDVKSKALAF
jgi:hypothetical protein